MINFKNSFFNFEIAEYTPRAVFFSIAFLIHNLIAVYYAYFFFHWYLSLSLKNMHSVEDTLIAGLYQRVVDL
jgi:hypothetical protein